MSTHRTRSVPAWPCGLLIATVLAYAPAAGAGDVFGGSLGVTTDYLFRGISQTRGAPAVQGGVHARLPGDWVVGVWSSTVDLNAGPGATLEVDLHAGKMWTIDEDWSAKLAVTHYIYPNDTWRLRYDYDELTASVAYQSRIVATASWSPNTSRRSGNYVAERRKAASYELAMLQPVANNWSLAAGLGYYDLNDLFGTGYWYWNAGFSWSVGAVQVDLSHINTDHTATRLFGYDLAGSNWSAAVTWRF